MSKEKQLLSVKNLEIIYTSRKKKVRAVNNISFSLNRGETLGLVGETGAGKTTTAYAIMSLLPERTAKVINGTIEFEGQNLLEVSEETMQHGIRGDKIAIVFQDPMTALNPIMKVGDQIEEALKYHNKEN